MLQLNVYAVDEGVPPRRSSPQVVTITVVRNLNSPQFENEPYERTINQDAQPGSAVFNVRTRDGDRRVSTPFSRCDFCRLSCARDAFPIHRVNKGF